MSPSKIINPNDNPLRVLLYSPTTIKFYDAKYVNQITGNGKRETGNIKFQIPNPKLEIQSSFFWFNAIIFASKR